MRAASGGAFDVAVGRAVDEWGFGPSSGRRPCCRRRRCKPCSGEHRADALALDAHAGTLTRQAPVLANLSGIAKGYGVDQAAQALERLGLGDYMVEVGGEIRARGRNAEGRPWQLAIERPDAMPQRALRIVPLDGKSLATSGDYRNFFMHEGRRYSHEIDPASAAPVEPCAGVGQRRGRRLHARRRLVDRAVRARARARLRDGASAARPRGLLRRAPAPTARSANGRPRPSPRSAATPRR